MILLPLEYAARNAGRNRLRTLLIAGGAAAVVFLVILMGSFVQTLSSTFRATGDARNAIVMGAGSEDFLEQSEIGFDVPTVLAASVPEIALHHGTPMVSPEIHHASLVRLSEDEASRNEEHRLGVVRGITPMAFPVHQQVYLKEGRTPGPGEVFVGRLAATKLGIAETALKPGSSIFFDSRTWTVSGIFEAPGTSLEGELWVPLDDLRIQTRRESLTCVVVRLNSPDDFPALEEFTKTRLDLELGAVSEVRYYSGLATLFRPIQLLGWIMAALVVLSGAFAGLNTTIAAIAARTRELACLETLGYSRRAIVISLLQESLLQVGAGALLAFALAVTLLAGRAVRFSMGAVALDVSAPVLAAGFAAALILAFAGTLFASARLVRIPLVEMLRV